MTAHACEYRWGSQDHSDDLWEIHHGAAKPAYMCGFHYFSDEGFAASEPILIRIK